MIKAMNNGRVSTRNVIIIIQRCIPCRFEIPALFTALDVNPKDVIVIKFAVIRRGEDRRNSAGKTVTLIVSDSVKFSDNLLRGEK